MVRHLGVQDYTHTWHAMRQFTQTRDADTPDELWVCQHPAVFTQGHAGSPEYLGALGDIPLVHTDRGGQVTYHGLGQWVFYPLIDLHRRKLGVKAFVHLLEQVTIDLLAAHHIVAERREGAPGIYVSGQKIASLGLKIHKGRSYHGLALNVAMDLSPFTRIIPCGLAQMQVTDWQSQQPSPPLSSAAQQQIAQEWVDDFRESI